MDRNAQEKRLAVETARELSRALRPHIRGPIDFRTRIVARDEETEGWAITVANISNPRLTLELWFDTWPGYRSRCFWYGVSSGGKLRIPCLPRKPHLDDADLQKNRLRVPIHQKILEQPLWEQYVKTSGYSFYGFYDRGQAAKDGLASLDTDRAVNRIETILCSIPGFQIDRTNQDYESLENRQLVVSHVQRERDARLATECKERDRYICQICGFDFEQHYGLIGREFAEAHHKIPLKKLDGPVPRTKKHLITVCSNCHRMLHRLKGEEGDIDKLRRVLRMRGIAQAPQKSPVFRDGSGHIADDYSNIVVERRGPIVTLKAAKRH